MKKATICILFLVLSASLRANNIQITNIATSIVGGNVILRFDLSWENSWRAASTANWDGAWVFFKFRDSDGKWKPLHFTGTGILVPAGYSMDISSKPGSVNVGAFIYRNSLGYGSVALTAVRAGIENIPGTFDVKGFAIETVYIPQGTFYAGDGNGYASTLSSTYADGGTNNPFKVIGDGAVTQLGNTAGKLGGYYEQNATSFLTGFPTGYSAYWIMKYELSQGGYRDFLNTLTYRQQDSLITAAPSAPVGTPINTFLNYVRGRLEIATPGVAATNAPAIFGCDYNDNNVYDEAGDGEWISMTYITWRSVAAYFDWSGLRPFTELEFEKAARGPLVATLNEFAWGNNQIANGGLYTIINGGTTSEAVSNMSNVEGNAQYDVTSTYLNMRGGIFATPTSTRINTGAGYYGAMELSGSLDEYCVGTADISGRSFTARHGDGILNINGEADVDFWPGINGNSNAATANTIYMGTTGVTETAGLTRRGGNLYLPNDNFHWFTISKKTLGNLGSAASLSAGIRGARDAN